MKDKVELIIWDFSRTLIFPRENSYKGGLNELYENSPTKSFTDLYRINPELFRFIDDIKDNVPSIIFTTGKFQEDPEITGIIANTFYDIETVEEVGFAKSDPRSYTKICEKYDAKPSEVLYIDDQENNIIAANQIGIRVMQYKGNDDEIIQFIKQNLQ
jgi:FMN phosphatase YigB (HAD superfamily)